MFENNKSLLIKLNQLKMQLFYQPEAETGFEFAFDREESRHISKVLRMTKGDYIQLTNGKGDLFKAFIVSDDPRSVRVRAEDKEHEPARAFSIHIAMAPTKNIKRTEWFVEKAVELGVEKISFFSSRYSERRSIKTARIEKLAISAMKQSLKYYLPEIRGLQSLNEVLPSVHEENRWIAHCYEDMTRQKPGNIKPCSDSIVLIGPEGGFSREEIKEALARGFQPLELSPYRLRTETAALAACQWLNIENQYNL